MLRDLQLICLQTQTHREIAEPHTQNRCDKPSADVVEPDDLDPAVSSVTGSSKLGSSAHIASDESRSAKANCN